MATSVCLRGTIANRPSTYLVATTQLHDEDAVRVRDMVQERGLALGIPTLVRILQ